ncbi:MAG: haloacid dehalogenase [Chloroflexota bacterium]
MQALEEIAENARLNFEAQTKARDKALSQTRVLIRHCAHAIRAVHREERVTALEELSQAQALVFSLQSDLEVYPQLYHAGYTQDALKEFAEAKITFAFIFNEELPSPGELRLGYGTYLQGLAEANGELRRRCLDILRHGYSEEAERLLGAMDDIYAILVTMDFADAITGGLRRLTDIVRSINERTRGDLTITLRESHLENSLKRLEEQMKNGDWKTDHHPSI